MSKNVNKLFLVLFSEAVLLILLRCPFSLVGTTEELLGRKKNSGSGLESRGIRYAEHVALSTRKS
jgi:hypothetical protein